MNIKFNLKDDLHLRKTLEFHNMVIVVRSVLHENHKSYPQAFSDECLHNL